MTSEYDAGTGLLSTATGLDDVQVSYGYAGRLLDRLSWSGPVTGTVEQTLDPLGRVVGEAVNGDAGWAFGYDDGGLLTALGDLAITRDPTTGLTTATVAGAVRSAQTHDGRGLVSRVTTTVEGTIVLDQAYRRDAFGRIIGFDETGADGRTVRTEYAYDTADRLASVTVDGAVIERDEYDANGNRVGVTGGGTPVGATYDATDLLLTWGEATFSYAPDGMRATRRVGTETTSYRADALGKLRSVTLPSGRVVSYLIDAAGRRVGRRIDGTLVQGFLYGPNGSVVAETDGSGAIVARFAYDDLGHLALVGRDGGTFRIVTDAIGSPRLAIDVATGVVAAARPTTRGVGSSRTNRPGLPAVRLRRRALDPDTRLVRFGARDYDPEIGVLRLSPDPILASWPATPTSTGTRSATRSTGRTRRGWIRTMSGPSAIRRGRLRPGRPRARGHPAGRRRRPGHHHPHQHHLRRLRRSSRAQASSAGLRTRGLPGGRRSASSRAARTRARPSRAPASSASAPTARSAS